MKNLRIADVRGLADVVMLVTSEVTNVVEGVHDAVLRTVGLAGGNAPGETGGLTGSIYRTINGVTRLTGASIGSGFALAESLVDPAGESAHPAPRRDAFVAALNGVIGDRLAATGNPLASAMEMRHAGRTIDWGAEPALAAASGRVLLLIHGLCMDDQAWSDDQASEAVDYGTLLATAAGYTPVYLRYNSGLSVAENGRSLAWMLEMLAGHWPVAIESITLVGYSMGGLLARSAVHQARERRMGWPDRLRHLVFLGTPHHGAPLERAGAALEGLLHGMPHTRPFAALARLRSAGITDLRYGRFLDRGNLRSGEARSPSEGVRASPVETCRLPEGVDAYAVAATRSSDVSRRRPRIGDGFVPVWSALGEHPSADRDLGIEDAAKLVVYDTHHLRLLRNEAVSRALLRWLAD